ncbi:MAG: AAA family ATPase [Acidimicrobiia bacterium]|nr:AAA family ATPase [Acidimicrobiia bacterium]
MTTPTDFPTAVAPSLVGRATEVEALMAALSAVLDGGPGSAIVARGAAGMGKSALLRSVLDASEGAAVATAMGRTRGELPFGVARGVATDLLGQLDAGEASAVLAGAAGRAWEQLNGGRAGADRAGVVYGLAWLVANVAELLMVDDVHAIDPLSRSVLEALVPWVHDSPLLVLVAERTGASHPFAGTETLDLGPLSPAEVAALVRRRTGQASDAQETELLWRATAGVPLRVVRSLDRPAGRLGAWGADPEGPLSADRRPGLQPRDTVARVRAATAVLSGPAPLAQVAALAAVDDADVVTAVAEAGLIDDAGTVRFGHPTEEEDVYDDLSDDERRRLHRRALQLLAGEPASVLAGHLLALGPVTSTDDVVLVRSTAATCATSGDVMMAAHLLAAIDDSLLAAAEAYDVLMARGRAQAAAGHTEAAITFERAAAIVEEDPARRLQASEELAACHFRAGAAPAAVALLREQVDLAPAALRPVAQVAWARVARFVLPERAALAQVVDELLVTGWPSAEEDPASAGFLGELAFERAAVVRFGADHAGELALRALDGDRLLEMETADGMGWWWAAYALHLAGRNNEAVQTLDAAVADAQARGSVVGYVQAMALRSGPAFHLGRLDDAAADAELAVAAGRREHRVFLPSTRGTLAQVHTWMGDLDAAAAVLAAQEAEGGVGSGADMLHLYGRSVHLLARGRPAEALACLEAAAEQQRVGRGDNPAMLPWRSAAAEALVALGEMERAVVLAAEELALAEQFGAPGPIGIARRAAALTAGADERIDLLRSAVDAHELGERRVEHVQALTDLGRALRAAGAVTDARPVLREAMGLADECRAGLLTAAARAELVAAGGRPRRTALRGVDALTPAERRVVGLAADGLTNREIAESLFLSRKAVEWHLTSSYRKLGVAGRQEASALLRPTSGTSR